MSAAGFTPIQLYRSTTASAVPTSGNLADGELAINTNDGKLYYKDSGGTVQLIASKAGASGDVVGPASATDNAVVRFDGTTGKLVQNSVVTIADSTGDIAGAGSITSTSASGILTRAAATQDGVELIGRAGGSSSYKVTLTPTTLGGNRTLTLPDTTGTVALTGSTVASFSAGSTGFTPNSATTGAVTLAGTLATTNGGTGLTSFTANGVVYASSSSALATGSALTFDGTNLLQVNAAAGKLRLGVNTSDQFLDIYRDNGSGASVYNAAQGSGFGFHVWQVASSEQMRLTSTGLGIGTSSLFTKFTVQDTERFEVSGGSGFTYSQSLNAARTATVEHRSYGSFLTWWTGAGGSQAERMRLDSSGNLGLGVTPSAWETGWKGFEFKAAGNSLFSGGDSDVRLTSGAYYNTGWKYGVTGSAVSYYFQGAGAHAWFTAPSGTAGNAISFTQVLTLDASGNLLLGGTSTPTSSAGNLVMFNGTAPTGNVTNGCTLFCEDVSSSSELKVRDEAGNVTTLSPHNFSLIPEGPSEDMAWSYYSERDGRRINIDMLKAIRLLEKISGEQLVYES